MLATYLQYHGPRIDPGEGLDGTPRDSNRLLGRFVWEKVPRKIFQENPGKILQYLLFQNTNARHFCREAGCRSGFCQKNQRAPIKRKSPRYPPLKRGILWTWAFPAEKAHFFQASIKLAHPFSAPELRTRISRTRGFFSASSKPTRICTAPFE